jgi:hypothetical protein
LRRLALLLPLLFGCPAAHDDYPTKACKSVMDCFQGEICQLNGGDTGTCVPEPKSPDLSSTGDGGAK